MVLFSILVTAVVFAGKPCADNLLPALCQQFSSGCADNSFIRRECAATCGLCASPANPAGQLFNTLPTGQLSPSHAYLRQLDSDRDEKVSLDELEGWFRLLPRRSIHEQFMFDAIYARKCEGRNATYDEAATRVLESGYWDWRICETCHKGYLSAMEALRRLQGPGTVSGGHSPEMDADYESPLSLAVAIIAARRSADREMMVLHTLHELLYLCEANVTVQVGEFDSRIGDGDGSPAPPTFSDAGAGVLVRSVERAASASRRAVLLSQTGTRLMLRAAMSGLSERHLDRDLCLLREQQRPLSIVHVIMEEDPRDPANLQAAYRVDFANRLGRFKWFAYLEDDMKFLARHFFHIIDETRLLLSNPLVIENARRMLLPCLLRYEFGSHSRCSSTDTSQFPSAADPSPSLQKNQHTVAHAHTRGRCHRLRDIEQRHVSRGAVNCGSPTSRFATGPARTRSMRRALFSGLLSA